jgi:hypothetical protein
MAERAGDDAQIEQLFAVELAPQPMLAAHVQIQVFSVKIEGEQVDDRVDHPLMISMGRTGGCFHLEAIDVSGTQSAVVIGTHLLLYIFFRRTPLPPPPSTAVAGLQHYRVFGIVS